MDKKANSQRSIRLGRSADVQELRSGEIPDKSQPRRALKNTPKLAKFLRLAAKLIKIAERQNRQFYVILMGDE